MTFHLFANKLATYMLMPAYSAGLQGNREMLPAKVKHVRRSIEKRLLFFILLFCFWRNINERRLVILRHNQKFIKEIISLVNELCIDTKVSKV